MAVVFYGTGSVWIAKGHRFARFVDGKYSTDDADDIAVLSAKYGHEVVGVPDKVENDNTPEAVKPKRGRPRNGT